ncbi:MAG: NAD(P)H-dependent flavin oxidoreductase [Myxococcota bacterium]
MRHHTRLTDLLNIQYPIMSAGMAGIAGPKLVAAVSNAGGIGTLGAIGMSPSELRRCIQDTKALLNPERPFGVDLLLPKIGSGARATNHDYTKGQLGALLEVMIEEDINLFVCAVGVPPKWAVEKLHQHQILVMNMVGSPKHVKYCIDAGVDIICAQGTEAGGHTGDISTMVLIPQVVDLCQNTNIIVVGAGGIFDGRGLAACMALGADGVWVGSRFIMAEEANAWPSHQLAIQKARSSDTIRTEIYTGRPARTLNNDYIQEWESDRYQEKVALLKSGTVPWFHDTQNGRLPASAPSPIPKGYHTINQNEIDPNLHDHSIMPVGQVCGPLQKVLPAQTIIENMMQDFLSSLSRLGLNTTET